MDTKPVVTIYTDGGCEPNPGAGAWAAVLLYGDVVKELSGTLPNATSNIAEMTAVLMALRALKRPCAVTVISDSQLVVNCGSGEWGRKANASLWEQIDHAAAPHDVTWRWVRGHSGVRWNERCHALVTARLRQPTR